MDDNEFDPETFIKIGEGLFVNEITYEEENQLAIEKLSKKIKEYEEKQKNNKKGFFVNLFTSKKDLLNELLEAEKYYYNKTLLNQLLRKVEQK